MDRILGLPKFWMNISFSEGIKCSQWTTPSPKILVCHTLEIMLVMLFFALSYSPKKEFWASVYPCPFLVFSH